MKVPVSVPHPGFHAFRMRVLVMLVVLVLVLMLVFHSLVGVQMIVLFCQVQPYSERHE